MNWPSVSPSNRQPAVQAPPAVPRQSSWGILVTIVFALIASTTSAQDDADSFLRAAARRNVAVASVLDAPMNTPAERMSAVFAMLELEEHKVAAALLAPALTAEYDAATRAELVTQFGTGRFLALARSERTAAAEAAPLTGARKFAEECLAAATQQSRNPQRIAALVKQLNASEAGVRNAARVDLSTTGIVGGKACFEALAQETDPQRRGNLMQAIVRLRPEVDPLVLAVLADGEGHLLRDTAEIAGHTGMLDAAPLLASIVVRPELGIEIRTAAQTALEAIGLSAADTTQARALLLAEISRLENGEPDRAAGSLREQEWWVWNASAQELSAVPLNAEQIRDASLHRLAQALIQLGLQAEQERQLFTTYSLGLPAQLATNYQQPALDQFTSEELSRALAAAVKKDLIRAATQFAAEMGRRRDLAVLQSSHGRPAPLASALRHPDRRLRFAALSAVMSINPQQSFAGASAVSKTVWDFAAGAGPAQAIAAASVSNRANDWAGQLRTAGFEATVATSGRDALQQMLDSANLRLLLLDSDIGRPRLREVLYQLRGNPESKRLPVAIFSSLPNLHKSQQLAEQDAYLLALARPHRAGDFEQVLQQLAQLDPAEDSPEERQQQSIQALKWIAQLQQSGHPYDELHRHASVASALAFDPQLSAAAIDTLALLGTAESQLALLDLTNNQTAAIETRQAAVKSFAASVQRFGKLLSPTQAAAQYDRYNASEDADQQTQQVLGQVLDILEDKPISNAGAPTAP